MKLNALLLLLLISLFLSGQSDFHFADSTAQWNFLHFQYYFLPSGHTYNNIIYTVEKDTTILSYQYQKIYSSQGIYSPSFLRQDTTGKVYVIPPNRNQEYNIYDFSKVAGDTFSIEDAELLTALYLSVKVDSVNYILLGGTLRKRMYVTLQNWSPDIWVEGIGSLYSNFLTPGIQWDWLDGEGRKLLCFFENKVRLYHKDNYPDTCFYNPTILSMDEPHNSSANDLLPVGHNRWRVSSAVNEAAIIFELMDLSGKIVHHQIITDTSMLIELHLLAGGLYIYRLSHATGHTDTGRLLLH